MRVSWVRFLPEAQGDSIMAINRKGMRKIVVAEKTFYYKIKHEFDCWTNTNSLCVLIEYPNGRIKTHDIYTDSRYTEFTPKNVSELIMLDMAEILATVQ